MVRSRIKQACAAAARDPAEVTLIGACKKQPVERIAATVAAGLRHLGANYVQEAREAQQRLAELLDGTHPSDGVEPCRWHLIGHLQRNKAAAAVELFHQIDSVDSPALVEALGRRSEGAQCELDICLQVNLSGEGSKSGVDRRDLSSLLAACGAWPRLHVIGLMTMPAPDPDPAAAAGPFAQLRELRDTLSTQRGGESLRHLNMGMSEDLEVAIAEGATLVRVGRDLFGERPAPQ